VAPDDPVVACCESGVCIQAFTSQCPKLGGQIVSDCASCQKATVGACCDAAGACTDSDPAACKGEFYSSTQCGAFKCPGSCDGKNPTRLADGVDLVRRMVPSQPNAWQHFGLASVCGLPQSIENSNGKSSKPPSGDFVEFDAHASGTF